MSTTDNLLLNGGCFANESAYHHHHQGHNQIGASQQQQHLQQQQVQSQPGNGFYGLQTAKNGQGNQWDEPQGQLRANSFTACSPVPFLSGKKLKIC